MGWAIHFKQESRNPFFLWILICTPLIYATMAYFLFQGGTDGRNARRRRDRDGDDGDLVADDDRLGSGASRRRRVGLLELPSPRRCPSGRRSPDHDRVSPRSASIRSRPALPVHPPAVRCRASGRRLERVCGCRAALASRSGCSASCSAPRSSGFRAAWAVGNLFEFPVWTICGLLIPIARAARLDRATVVGVRPDVGHERPAGRDTRHRVSVGRRRDVPGALRRLRRSRESSFSASSSAPRVAAERLR